MSSYLTVADYAFDEIEVKKSRFIGHIVPVSSQERAAAFIQNIRSENREARHNVYAYILREGNYCKFSDDSEPSGTAGKPILEVIKGNGLVDVCIVVTRYFGGILLGTGGLARAYSDAARLAVQKAKIIRMCEVCEMTCRCDYTHYGKITSLIADIGGHMENTDFDDAVNIRFYIPENTLSRFHSELSEITLGKTMAVFEKKSYKAENL